MAGSYTVVALSRRVARVASLVAVSSFLRRRLLSHTEVGERSLHEALRRTGGFEGMLQREGHFEACFLSSRRGAEKREDSQVYDVARYHNRPARWVRFI